MSVKPNGCIIVLSLLAFTVELILLKSKKEEAASKETTSPFLIYYQVIY